MRDVPTLAIVVPCFNESEMLPIAIPKMIDFLTHNKKNGKCKRYHVSEEQQIAFVFYRYPTHYCAESLITVSIDNQDYCVYLRRFRQISSLNQGYI